MNDYNDYKIGKSPPPPVIGSYTDNTNLDQLNYRIKADCAVAIQLPLGQKALTIDRNDMQ